MGFYDEPASSGEEMPEAVLDDELSVQCCIACNNCEQTRRIVGDLTDKLKLDEIMHRLESSVVRIEFIARLVYEHVVGSGRGGQVALECGARD